MTQKQLTDQELVLVILKENGGSLKIGDIIESFKNDSRSPKTLLVSEVMRNLESEELIAKGDKRLGQWNITEKGIKNLSKEVPENAEEVSKA